MKLRRFLNKKNEFKVFKLVLSGQKPIDVEQLKAIQSPPYELERVELELEFVPRTSFKSLKKRCDHGSQRTITLYFPNNDVNKITKFFCRTFEARHALLVKSVQMDIFPVNSGFFLALDSADGKEQSYYARTINCVGLCGRQCVSMPKRIPFGEPKRKVESRCCTRKVLKRVFCKLPIGIRSKAVLVGQDHRLGVEVLTRTTARNPTRRAYFNEPIVLIRQGNKVAHSIATWVVGCNNEIVLEVRVPDCALECVMEDVRFVSIV
ncbi:hypothetical protein Tco_1427713 [Tanacetum coccineum]